MASGSAVLTSRPISSNEVSTKPRERLPPKIVKTPPRDTGLDTHGYVTVRGKYSEPQVAELFSVVTEYLEEGSFRPHSDGVVLSPLDSLDLSLDLVDRFCSGYFKTKGLQTHRSACYPVLRSSETGYLPMHRERWSVTLANHKVECIDGKWTYPLKEQPVTSLSVHVALTPQSFVLVPIAELSPESFSRFGVELLDPIVTRSVLVKLQPGDVLIHRSDLGKEFLKLKKTSPKEWGLTFGYSDVPELVSESGELLRYYNGRPVV